MVSISYPQTAVAVFNSLIQPNFNSVKWDSLLDISLHSQNLKVGLTRMLFDVPQLRLVDLLLGAWC
jgi:hypothetical protein